MKQRDDAVVETAYIGLRIPADLRDRLVKRAESQDRSLSAEVRRALAEHLERAA